MKKLMFLFLSVFLFSCSKDDLNVKTKHEVRFSNNSSSPYTVTINFNDDKEVFVLQGKEYVIRKYDEGTFIIWYVKQNSGYLIYPTEQTGNFTVTREHLVSFPN
ncbi:MAG: hypothetical protein Q4G08_02910 [Capnocytophaga sp.]|nr:hypothetical protein [Capnocytophaga sp.]